MVAAAPSIVPCQVTIFASALVARPNGATARPAAAALMRIKRLREIARVIVFSSILSSARSVAVRSRGSRTGRLARSQHVVTWHLRERDDTPAVFGLELLRGTPLGE